METNDDMEHSALVKFKEKVKDVLDQDERLLDADLLRFLKARNYQLDKAEQMLRNYMDWWDRNRMDEAAGWDVAEIVQNSFPTYYDGLDKEGRPVLYLPLGSWPTRQFILDGYKPEMERNIYRVMANIVKVVENNEWDTFITIIDLAGMTYTQMMHYESLQMVLRVLREYEQNFPERLHQAFVINAPWMMNVVFPTIKSLLRGTTVDKLQIFDGNPNNFFPALLNYVEPSGFPQGFRKCHGELLDSWCSANN